jgi:hypothetical protein
LRPIPGPIFKACVIAGQECPHSILIVRQIAAECLTKSIRQILVVPNQVVNLLMWIVLGLIN